MSTLNYSEQEMPSTNITTPSSDSLDNHPTDQLTQAALSTLPGFNKKDRVSYKWASNIPYFSPRIMVELPPTDPEPMENSEEFEAVFGQYDSFAATEKAKETSERICRERGMEMMQEVLVAMEQEDEVAVELHPVLYDGEAVDEGNPKEERRFTAEEKGKWKEVIVEDQQKELENFVDLVSDIFPHMGGVFDPLLQMKRGDYDSVPVLDGGEVVNEEISEEEERRLTTEEKEKWKEVIAEDPQKEQKNIADGVSDTVPHEGGIFDVYGWSLCSA